MGRKAIGTGFVLSWNLKKRGYWLDVGVEGRIIWRWI
jgi:hypothetical protein